MGGNVGWVAGSVTGVDGGSVGWVVLGSGSTG